jgi:hypothetical protein
MQARADGFVVPWAGVDFGSSAVDGRSSFGATAGWMGEGLVGAAVDFGYNRSFFGNEGEFGTNKVIDLMGNVYLRIPVTGPWAGSWGTGMHPYVTGGVGYIRSQIDGGGTVANFGKTNNMFGWNGGAGLAGFFTEHVGLRADIRYLRSFEGLNTGVPSLDFNEGVNRQLNYWRVSGGVVLK